MSTINAKYADLPDIDTAPDVYETEDATPTSNVKEDSSDEEAPFPTRTSRNRVEAANKEELDSTSLMDTEAASAKFRKAERRQKWIKTRYEYPPSPTSPDSPSGSLNVPRGATLSNRLRILETELMSLETELSDPSNPLIQREREQSGVDPGELIRGLVDVRSRLEKIKKGKEGRAKLVGAIMDPEVPKSRPAPENTESPASTLISAPTPERTEMQSMVELERRLGELEALVGSSNTSLDEASPMPNPLLPLVTRLSNQLTLLSQPRHIDAISRRLKLLLSDLERTSAHQNKSHSRQQSQPNGPSQSASLQEQILPLLQRLTPLLPQIPHLLARLRSLSALHTSATQFQATVTALEEEQTKLHAIVQELDTAVRGVESSLNDNREVVRGNVAGLENRVNSLLTRLEDLRLKGAEDA